MAHCSQDIVPFFLHRNGWTKCPKFFARCSFVFRWTLSITIIIIVTVLSLSCCFFLTNACNGFEPYNERMNETSNETNAPQTHEKKKMKTLLSAYSVARVRFTQRNCLSCTMCEACFSLTHSLAHFGCSLNATSTIH